MAGPSIQVEYHQGLEPLEKVLSKVRRSGDFFVQGRVEVPIPKLEVDGIGVVSFPVPETQIRQLIEQAERAPYGRGEETILDTSVRKVWQLPPDKVRLGGKSWAGSFQSIMGQAAAGLGCAESAVSAEFYKLLVYDQGSFFKAHRDTEKADGMFGTLVVVLPSAHRGGELVVRHAGREVMVDLSVAEPSELAFAAFYADCEHEVRPMVEGNRVCLIYNLVQRRERKAAGSSLTAPLYDAEVAAAAKCIAEAMDAPEAPTKIVWLLEHQYSPASLSFAGLKNADAARAKVLSQAATQAGCAVHLGIVHIEEYGPAEPTYGGGYGHGRRSRWRSYDDEEIEEHASSDEFEIIEVSDSWRYIDQWIDAQDRRVDFGKIPLGEGELLPQGALDDENPDKQRVTEATGNEGASFERSYHRAALILWPQERFAEVLLQSGIGAVIPYLKDKVEASVASAKPDAREQATALATHILDVWENTPEYQLYGRSSKEPSRTELIDVLGRLGEAKLLERFVGGIVTRKYDGTENAPLAAHVRLLKPTQAGKLLSDLADANMQWLHGACVNLLRRLLPEHEAKPPDDWAAAFQKMAAAIVEGLDKIENVSERNLDYADWQRAEQAKPPHPELVADLLDALAVLEAEALREKAATNIVRRTAVFDPGRVVVPALRLMQKRHGQGIESEAAFLRLWQHAAEFLLARSEHPPVPPSDWRQEVAISCRCEDCRALQKFVRDADVQVGRFRVRQDRRQHLHQQIERHGLDMTHVTERKGSPQTLVCTKTRRTYERQCEQHKADRASMTTLLTVKPDVRGDLANLALRMATARERRPQS